jgi:hypothetical protein
VGDLLLKLVSFRPIDVVYITDSILTRWTDALQKHEPARAEPRAHPIGVDGLIAHRRMGGEQLSYTASATRSGKKE